jgi:mycothiol synthase
VPTPQPTPPTPPAFPAALAPGLRARRADLDADRAGVIELVRAIDAAYVGRPSQPPEQVVADLEESEDLATDVWVVDDGDRIAGLGWFVVENPGPPRPVLWFDVYVAPDLAGAGLETALVEAMLARARQWPRPEGTEALLVESGCQQADTRTGEALRAAGFTPERTFWRMERRIDTSLMVPEPPTGVTVRRAADEPGDRALIHRLFTQTFDQHWGTVMRPEDEWWQRVRGVVGFDPTQWWVAEADGEPVGFLLGDASRAAENGGYVRTLGVTREARGRGIGRHLLLVAFAEQAGRGWTWSQLTVDTGNATGAPKLYGSVGMRPVEVIDLYRGVLADDGSLAPGTSRVS